MIQGHPFDGEYTFTDETYLSATEKWQILHDWQGFLLSGFKKLFFTRALWLFLTQHCAFTAHSNQTQFWTFYFDFEVLRLRHFLAQFSGNQYSVEYGTRVWLDGPAADLKAAMCAEASQLYAPLNQVLQDLEIKHEEMVQAWHEFALNSGIQEVTLPPHYIVSENTRNLLAYAAYIATRQQRPLASLQMMFPSFHRDVLLHSMPVAEIQG